MSDHTIAFLLHAVILAVMIVPALYAAHCCDSLVVKLFLTGFSLLIVHHDLSSRDVDNSHKPG